MPPLDAARKQRSRGLLGVGAVGGLGSVGAVGVVGGGVGAEAGVKGAPGFLRRLCLNASGLGVDFRGKSSFLEDDLLQVRREKVDHIRVFADFILLLEVDGGEGAEEEVTGVGHDGGAAGRDALLRLEKEKPGEEVVDRDGGLELGETGDELGGETGGMVAFVLAASVLGAE